MSHNFETGEVRVGTRREKSYCFGVNFKSRNLKLIVFGVLIFSVLAYSQTKDEGEKTSSNYINRNINNARFGDKDWRELVQKIYKLEDTSEIVGQRNTLRALQNRLVTYMENLGSLKGEPMGFHMIGPPGVGKTAIADTLENLGILVGRFDAQQFTRGYADFFFFLADFIQVNQLDSQEGSVEPVILIVEELDKVAELESNREKTNDFVGTLNQILSEGRITKGSVSYDVSNFFVVTTQNIPAATYEAFSNKVLKKPLSFFEMTTPDFIQFHEWITREKSAASILSQIFRSNTVSRIVPNAYLMEPLNDPDFLGLTRKAVSNAIESSTKDRSLRLEVTYGDSLVNFLKEVTTLPATGARNTIMRTNHLMLQLIAFGKRASPAGDNTLDKPRNIRLEYDPVQNIAEIKVTALKQISGKLVPANEFSIFSKYDSNSGGFSIPPEVVDYVEPPPPQSEDLIKRVTGREVYEARFSETSGVAAQVEAEINQRVFGQEELATQIANELDQYLSRQGVSTTQPASKVLAGFAGTGKSISITEAARILDLPLIRINLQSFASDDSSVASKFILSVNQEIARVKKLRPDHKYILLLEELDKIFEVDPQTGLLVARPIMGLIKDVLNNGRAEGLSGEEISQVHRLDVRDAFLALTMNFAMDLFRFEADPRLTSIEDTMEAWERLSTRLQDLKEVLGAMFLPETVNRLLPKTIVVPPLSEKAYKKIIGAQMERVISERFQDENNRNVGKIELELTLAYRKYLFREAVIPSEGGRYTETKAKDLISQDLEEAIAQLPRDPQFATKALIIRLHYREGSESVVATAIAKERSDLAPKEIFVKPVALNFPPLRARGKIDPFRVFVTGHEFGHAFAAVRLGIRFSYTTVVSPKKGVGGYVKPTGGDFSALARMTDIYMTLASRAMERILLSDKPLRPESVLEITPGSVTDIQMATRSLFTMLYELGFNPYGPTISRKVGERTGSQSFYDLSQDETKKLGAILREMENFLVKDFLVAHSKDWYVKKISEFARVGGLNEAEFYELVGYPYPGDNDIHVTDYEKLFETFGGLIEPHPKEVMKTLAKKTGADQLTALERAKKFRDFFTKVLKANYAPTRPKTQKKLVCKRTLS